MAARVPTKAELDRIRYTPITAGFVPVAELSRQIANRRGLSADIEANGETKGVLAYPNDPSTVSFAESNSPWSLADGKKVLFVVLPHEPAEATGRLRELSQ